MIEVEALKWGADGLLPVVTQDQATGVVLMQAWANREALARTIESGEATYWSRSRQSLWVKGETSGNRQSIRAIRTDCDLDSLLYVVEQSGVACHEGSFSCFTKEVATMAATPEAPITAPEIGALLSQVEAVLRSRKVSADPGSYTAKLFVGGPDAYCKKIGEEATEVILAAKNGDPENLAWEVADLWFHSLVALVDAGVGTAEVAAQLQSRQGKRRVSHDPA